jgi:hypothetical protein
VRDWAGAAGEAGFSVLVMLQFTRVRAGAG